MPTINCLRQIVVSGPHHFPIYVGFLSAKDVLEIAEVPSFSESTDHHDIATNILAPPIKDWQRPIDEHRVVEIARLFDNSGELMPNPVLLGENLLSMNHTIIVNQQVAPGGTPTNVWEVEIEPAGANTPKPLWILDGQHRINGLAKSPQAENAIPVVLLINAGENVYSAPTLAKLFGQVTTSAQKLDELHNEWLTFSFNLGAYNPTTPKGTEHKQAMRAVAELCKRPQVHSGTVNNPFFNRVRFNIHVGGGAIKGGFNYSCIELKEIFRKYYYSCASKTGGYLAPPDLAEQVALAYEDLTKMVTMPQDKSVFFGDTEHGQQIMQDAFIVGVLSYLLSHGRPESWLALLEALAFKTTNWNFKTWVFTLSGRANAASKELAFRVFKKVFQQKTLPEGAGNIANYLRGNNALVTLEFYHLTPAGKKSTKDPMKLDLQRGAVLSATVGGRRYVRVAKMTENIGSLKVTDKQSPPGRLVEYDFSKGLLLDQKLHSSPLQLLITMQYYGGTENTSEVDVSWQEG